MSSFAWMMVVVGLLTLLGSAALLFVTVRYYWGAKGSPPLTGEARKRQWEEELQMRAEQFKYSETHPIKPRSTSFLDNTKT